jgi:serine/threonine protein kinase
MATLELPAGSEIAGYRVEQVAGRGGMGVVYRATELALDRPVALKLISEDLARDEGFRARFQRESRLAASIRHPNVITVFHAGEDEGVLYIATEFIEGTDLKTMIAQRGSLEPRLAADITAQVAAALDAAHAKGLVHRDVKPANVLIASEDGGWHAYLSDFGLTKRTTSQSAMTETGLFIGTIDYASPEQISGQPVDGRTDVYSLGCVLYEQLTGRQPYPRDTHVATMYAHAHEPPPSIREVAPALPPALDEVVQRAMAKAPGDRYPSAGDLARAASAAAAGTAVAEPERSVAAGPAAPGGAASTALSPDTRPKPRRRWLAAIAGLALVVAAALAAILLTGGDDSSEPTPLSKDAYQDRMVDLSRDISAATTRTGDLPDDVTTPEDKLRAANSLARLRDSYARTLADMRRIVPPADITDVHARTVDLVARIRTHIADAVAAADFSNEEVYRSSLQEAEQESQKVNALAKQFRDRGYERLGIESG